MVLKPKWLKLNLSTQLLLSLGIAVFFGHLLPDALQALFYSISLTLKGILIFVLPLVIFSCLFSCLLTFRGASSIGLMFLLFSIVFISNYFSTLIAYGIGSLQLITLDVIEHDHTQMITELTPLWNLIFPTWISNEVSLGLGFAAGAYFSLFPHKWADNFSLRAKNWVTLFLEKGFVPLLPLFAFGFILKMRHDGVLLQVIESYLPLLLIILVTYFMYLILLFGLAAKFNLKKWGQMIKNVIPVMLTGFSTMSSLATMPVTLSAAEKNTGNIDIARVVIPATVNVHMVGVAIGIPLMAFAILSSFGYPLPNFNEFCLFAVYFVLAQFTVAAIPGGGILVMLPLLESHFGFTGEMCALITALYILFDPAITITNVVGNSALVIFVSKLFERFTITVNENV